MIEIWTRTIKRDTDEVLYEGIKHTFDSYDEARKALFRVKRSIEQHLGPGNTLGWHFPTERKWNTGSRCYVSFDIWSGFKTILHIKRKK